MKIKHHNILDEVAAFGQADEALKEIFYVLLSPTKEFGAFFRFLDHRSIIPDAPALIRLKFNDEICEQANLTKVIAEHPIELAYCLALINSFITYKKVHSITPPWVLKNYPEVERIMLLLRSKPCITGCNYCNSALDIHKELKNFFGFDAYRTYGGESSYLISLLVSGDTLRINADECLNTYGQPVLKFSTKFKEKIDEMKSKNYELRGVKVNFILYWLKEGASQEIKVILPEIYFERRAMK